MIPDIRAIVIVLAIALPSSAFAGVLTGQWPGRAGECELKLEEYDREVLHLRMRRAGMMWDTCTPEAAALAEALGGLLRAARAGRDDLCRSSRADDGRMGGFFIMG